MENKALNELKKMLPPVFTVEIASVKHDFQYGVDLIIKKDNVEVCGVQVKPTSYMNIPDSHEVKEINKKKNKLYGKAVHFIYYDKDSDFINTNEVTKLIITTN